MKHPVRILEVLASASCNMGCEYCFEGKSKIPNKFITFQQMKNFIDNGYNESFYIFGGEPLLNLDVIEETINYIESLDLAEDRKNKLLKSARSITTNGTLIKNNIERIKKLKLKFQISIDGPKHVNDMNRYYKNKKSAYDDVLEGIRLCNENNIEWDLHGVLSPNALLNYLDIIKWRIDLYKELNKSDDYIIKAFNGNWAMILFEYDYTDKFIDDFLAELEKTADWIIYESPFKPEQRRMLYKNIIEREGVYGICSAGRDLLTLDTSGDIYPCHRSVDELTTYNFKDKTCLGNIDDVENFKNFTFYNRFDEIAERGIMYSHDFILDSNDKKFKSNYKWGMWCPTSNMETSNSELYINAKYVVFVEEINNFIATYLNKKYFQSNVQAKII